MYPWAVAVWALYPLAMIEVVTGVNLFQESVDNDLMRLSLSELFTSKYFKVYNGVAGVAPVDLFPKTPCAYMVYMDASFIPFGRDFLNTHVAVLVEDPRPIMYWQGEKLAIAVMHARPYMKMFRDAAGGRTIHIEMDFTYRAIGNYDTYTDLLLVTDGAEPLPGTYFAQLKPGADFYQGHLKELLAKYPPLPNRPCDDSNSNSTIPTRRRRLASVDGSRSRRDEKNDVFYLQRNRAYHTSDHRCAPPDNLIVDAVYVPMPFVGDNVDNGPEYPKGPTIWLTSSLPPLPFRTVFKTFSKGQIETIVQHLDPILQNPNMLKILPFMPGDIADALKHFDAANYPNVISLRDMEYPHWGEKCS